MSTLLADGDTVVLETRFRSTLPDGRPYDNAYCFLVTVRDGRLHRIREHLDTHRGLVAFGMVGPSRRKRSDLAQTAPSQFD